MTSFVKVIVTAKKNSQFEMRQTKFHASEDMKVGGFLQQLRKHVVPAIKDYEALFLLVKTATGGYMAATTSHSMDIVAHEYQDHNKITHMVLCRENVFGC